MSVILLFLLFSMLAVIVFDITKYIIPNWLVGALLLVYPVAVFLSPVAVDWQMALVGMLAVFAVGYVIFALNWMGGGDIKLIIVLSLWVGWGEKLLGFIMSFCVLGGALSIALLLIRKFIPNITKRRGEELPKIFRDKAPVPYGIAIAAAFLIGLINGDIPLVQMPH